MKFIYPACFYPEDNGQFSVVFPDLDGIATYGNSLEDAVGMATDLLCMWILECKKDRKDLPEPSAVPEVRFERENGFASLIIADIDAYTAKNNRSVKKTLSIPAWLNELAEKEGVNFSGALQNALKEQLHLKV